MDGFIDIHTHILPGVDDGPKDILQAVALARMAYSDGTRGLFLTPHYRDPYKDNTPAWLQESFSMFCQLLRQELPELALYLGSELHYETQLPRLLENRSVLTMAGTRCVLLEFSYHAPGSQILSGVSEVYQGGFTPIIAHAERYDSFRKTPDLVDTARDMGALIQLNAQSVLGHQGFAVKRYCHRLLQEEKVHFIASDAHDVTRRPPLLKKCFDHVCKKYSPEYAHMLFCQNALDLLAEQE